MFPAVRGLSDPDLVKAAIAASGLSARQFAIQVARVNERTVRRWLNGSSTIRDASQRERIEAAATVGAKTRRRQ